jgi:glycosyltransferase involved in cell wall biosynthesis
MGYVSVSDLVGLYQTSGQFCLMSDYEAFGLPIAEALCCGLPVVLNFQRETAAIFGERPGVTFVDNMDAPALAEAIVANFQSNMDHDDIAARSQADFSTQTAYAVKLDALSR